MSRESINPIELRLQIGQKLRQARLDKGLSQKELGEKLGVTRVVVGMYERGRLRISIQLLLELSQTLKKPIQYFVDEDPAVVAEYEREQKSASYSLDENVEFSMEMSIRNYLRSAGKKGDITHMVDEILNYIKGIRS